MQNVMQSKQRREKVPGAAVILANRGAASQLAADLGVSRTCISNALAGLYDASQPWVRRILQAIAARAEEIKTAKG